MPRTRPAPPPAARGAGRLAGYVPAVAEPIALLLVPGLGLGPESWAPTLKVWGHNRASLVLPLPGYGRPAPPAMDLHPRTLASDLVGGVPPALGRLVVFGHSASCQVAAHVAALAPQRVAGLVLVGPSTDPRAATWPRLTGRWLATARHETPRQVPTLIPQYRRTTLRTMLRAMDAARSDSIQDALRRSTPPVLVVRGRFDRICPEDWAETVAGCGGTGSAAATLPAGGHMVPLTHGQLLASAVRQFVSRQSSPPHDSPAVSSEPDT